MPHRACKPVKLPCHRLVLPASKVYLQRANLCRSTVSSGQSLQMAYRGALCKPVDHSHLTAAHEHHCNMQAVAVQQSQQRKGNVDVHVVRARLKQQT